MVKILQKENKLLRKKSKPVDLSDIRKPEVKKVISDMKKMLAKEKDGVALAAPQIGVLLRIFVVSPKAFLIDSKLKKLEETNKTKKPEFRVFINPEIIKLSSDKEWMEEGCLSVRYIYGSVRRSKKVKIRAYDEKGKFFELGKSGLLAEIFQHELDHLDGVLFTDKAKDMIELSKDEYEKRS